MRHLRWEHLLRPPEAVRSFEGLEGCSKAVLNLRRFGRSHVLTAVHDYESGHVDYMPQ